MMGKQDEQKSLFYYGFRLEARVRENNPLRKIRQAVDFSWVRAEVRPLYGYNGNESVDPEVVLKMLFLLFYDDLPSERELMRIIPERLDYLWFLGYDLNDAIPDHSVLSKARQRWGAAVFERVFGRTVQQCVAAGLVDGAKLHVDTSLVAANASREAVVKGTPAWIAALKAAYQATEKKLDEVAPSPQARRDYTPENDRLLSTTDPDAALVRQGAGESKPRYKCHRVCDDAHGVITATATTRGDVADGLKLIGLVGQHEANTQAQAQTVVADSAYGTTANFRECGQRGLRSHMADLQRTNEPCRRRGIFTEAQFQYQADGDSYVCPAGQRLTRRKHKAARQVYEYAAGRKVCGACALKRQCTRSAERTVRRHEDHVLIERGRQEAHSAAAGRDRRRRRHLMEGSFAQSANEHHFKRARWRRLWRQRIQDHLIAAVQNVKILLKYLRPAVALARAQRLSAPNSVATSSTSSRSCALGVGHRLWRHLRLLCHPGRRSFNGFAQPMGRSRSWLSCVWPTI